jgi:hypothetical protein
LIGADKDPYLFVFSEFSSSTSSGDPETLALESVDEAGKRLSDLSLRLRSTLTLLGELCDGDGERQDEVGAEGVDTRRRLGLEEVWRGS